MFLVFASCKFEALDSSVFASVHLRISGMTFRMTQKAEIAAMVKIGLFFVSYCFSSHEKLLSNFFGGQAFDADIGCLHAAGSLVSSPRDTSNCGTSR